LLLPAGVGCIAGTPWPTRIDLSFTDHFFLSAGPQLFLSYEAPLYRTAMNTILGMYCAYIASMLLYRELCRRENNRRDKLAAEGVEEAKPRLATHESNDTDIDDLAFRYVV
jgi:hypothetical protein